MPCLSKLICHCILLQKEIQRGKPESVYKTFRLQNPSEFDPGTKTQISGELLPQLEAGLSTPLQHDNTHRGNVGQQIANKGKLSADKELLRSSIGRHQVSIDLPEHRHTSSVAVGPRLTSPQDQITKDDCSDPSTITDTPSTVTTNFDSHAKAAICTGDLNASQCCEKSLSLQQFNKTAHLASAETDPINRLQDINHYQENGNQHRLLFSGSDLMLASKRPRQSNSFHTSKLARLTPTRAKFSKVSDPNTVLKSVQDTERKAACKSGLAKVNATEQVNCVAKAQGFLRPAFQKEAASPSLRSEYENLGPEITAGECDSAWRVSTSKLPFAKSQHRFPAFEHSRW